MPLNGRQLHVVFGRSAAGTLRQALKLADCKDMVVAPSDDFSFGPIDADDIDARAQWVENALAVTGWLDVSRESLPVLEASKQAVEPPIAWVSPDHAPSVAGFLWWLSHMDDRACRVLDAPRLNLRDPNAMIEFLGSAEPLSASRRASDLALWKQLQRENAPLRILEGGRLRSVSIEYFDDVILNNVTEKWQKMALIIGRTLSGFSETGIFQTGDLVLTARLVELADTGAIAWRGDLNDMHRCEMRQAG